MKFLYKLGRMYDRLRYLTWLIPTLSTIGLPLMAYGASLLSMFKSKQDMMTDNPEGAREVTLPNPIEYLQSAQGVLPMLTRILVGAGIVLLLVAILAKIGSVLSATKISGLDKETQQQEADDRQNASEVFHDDYSDDDYDDEDYED